MIGSSGWRIILSLVIIHDYVPAIGTNRTCDVEQFITIKNEQLHCSQILHLVQFSVPKMFKS